MNLLRKLLVAIASAGAMGSSQAMDQTFHSSALPPVVEKGVDSHGASSAPMPYSFMDIANLTIGAGNRSPLVIAASRAPEGPVAEPVPALFAGSEGTGSVLDTVSPPNGSLIDLATVLVPGGLSARGPGFSDGQLAGGPGLSVAAAPEPAGWMLLLSSLVVVAFIARRKTSWTTG